MAFVENPCNLPVILHKDGNTLNNSASNLEWVANSAKMLRYQLLRETDAYYQTIKPEKLTGQNVFIYHYYLTGNETYIRQMFQTERMKAICGWYMDSYNPDEFESLYDELYETILQKIKQGYLRPRFGVRYDNVLFNYSVRTFSFMARYRHSRRVSIEQHA